MLSPANRAEPAGQPHEEKEKSAPLPQLEHSYNSIPGVVHKCKRECKMITLLEDDLKEKLW